MQFCPECKFMTYTKLNRTKTPHILENYCKNCGWKGIKEDVSKPIYKRHYQEDYIANKALSNKYTIFDVALPRVAYDCPNTECVTNIKFDPDKTVVITNIPPDHTEDEFNEIFSKFSEIIVKTYRVKLTSAIIVFNNSASKDTFTNSFDTKLINNYELYVNEYNPPDKEVIYIKYDPNNMNYIYICVNCGISWKKN